jgi:hypothetical protein
MEFISEDSEELFCKYGIVAPENAQVPFSLVGIVDAFNLAKAGRRVDVMENILYCPYEENILMGACQGGHKELVLLLIQLEFDSWNTGLIGACRGGHEELALLMIYNGARSVNFGLEEACSNGHKKLALLMIQHGAYAWNDGMYWACLSGHRELAEWLIHIMQPPGLQANWNTALYGYKSYHEKTIKLIISPSFPVIYSVGFRGACEGNHKDLALFMINKMGSCDISDELIRELSNALDVAIQFNYKEIILMILQKLDSFGHVPDWNSMLFVACQWKRKEIIAIAIQKGATKRCCHRPINEQ